MDVGLRFYDQVIVSSASQYAAYRFNPNCAYDVDPTLGSTATAGFNEAAAYYNFYRVISYSYDIVVMNREAFPLNVFVINCNLDPGTSTAYRTYMGNQFTSFKSISPQLGGKPSVRFRGSYTVSQIVGSLEPEYDNDWRAVTTSTPNDKIFLGIGADSAGGPNLTNGFTLTITITMHTRFYERKTLTS